MVYVPACGSGRPLNPMVGVIYAKRDIRRYEKTVYYAEAQFPPGAPIEYFPSVLLDVFQGTPVGIEDAK